MWEGREAPCLFIRGVGDGGGRGAKMKPDVTLPGNREGKDGTCSLMEFGGAEWSSADGMRPCQQENQSVSSGRGTFIMFLVGIVLFNAWENYSLFVRKTVLVRGRGNRKGVTASFFRRGT